MSDEELAVHDELLAAWKNAEQAGHVRGRTGDEYESWLVANGEWMVRELRQLQARVAGSELLKRERCANLESEKCQLQRRVIDLLRDVASLRERLRELDTVEAENARLKQAPDAAYRDTH